MAVPEQESAEPGTGIVHSLRQLAATLVALLRTRFELLASELEEERIRVLQLLFWAAAALFFLGISVLLLVLLLLVVFWDSHRVPAIMVLTGIFLAAGIGLAIGVRNRLHARSTLFSASLGELAKDHDRLTPR